MAFDPTLFTPVVSSKPAETTDVDTILREVSARHNVPLDLMQRMVKVESGGNPYAISPAGAMGVGQLMPATAAALGVKNPFDPRENLDAAARLLRQNLDIFNGDAQLAAAAYQSNPASVKSQLKKYGRLVSSDGITDTEDYARMVGGDSTTPAATKPNIDDFLASLTPVKPTETPKQTTTQAAQPPVLITQPSTPKPAPPAQSVPEAPKQETPPPVVGAPMYAGYDTSKTGVTLKDIVHAVKVAGKKFGEESNKMVGNIAALLTRAAVFTGQGLQTAAAAQVPGTSEKQLIARQKESLAQGKELGKKTKELVSSEAFYHLTDDDRAFLKEHKILGTGAEVVGSLTATVPLFAGVGGVTTAAAKAAVEGLVAKYGAATLLKQIPTIVKLVGESKAIPKVIQAIGETGGFANFEALNKMAENAAEGKDIFEGVPSSWAQGAALGASAVVGGEAAGGLLRKVAPEAGKAATIGAEATGQAIGAGAATAITPDATVQDVFVNGMMQGLMHGGFSALGKFGDPAKLESVKAAVESGDQAAVKAAVEDWSGTVNDAAKQELLAKLRTGEADLMERQQRQREAESNPRKAGYVREQKIVDQIKAKYPSRPTLRQVMDDFGFTNREEARTYVDDAFGPLTGQPQYTPPKVEENPTIPQSEVEALMNEQQNIRTANTPLLSRDELNRQMNQGAKREPAQTPVTEANQPQTAKGEPKNGQEKEVSQEALLTAEGAPPSPVKTESMEAPTPGRAEVRVTLEDKQAEILNDWQQKGLHQDLPPERLQQMAMSAAEKASVNDVTKLPSKSAFNSMVNRVAQKPTPETTPMYIESDIDRFKMFNDNFGHEYGDAVLQKIMPSVNAAFKEHGIEHFHKSGDEHSGIIEVPKGQEFQFLKKLKKIKKQLNDIDIELPNGKTVPISMTMVVSPRPGNADILLKDAKNNLGRGSLAIDNGFKKQYNINDLEGRDVLPEYQKAGMTEGVRNEPRSNSNRPENRQEVPGSEVVTGSTAGREATPRAELPTETKVTEKIAEEQKPKGNALPLIETPPAPTPEPKPESKPAKADKKAALERLRKKGQIEERPAAAIAPKQEAPAAEHVTKVTRWKDEIVGPGDLGIEVHADKSTLPEHLQTFAKDATIQAVYDPASKKIHLVAKEIPSRIAAEKAIKHEFTHRGMRALEGKRLKQLYKEIASAIPEEVKTPIIRDYFEKGFDPENPSHVFTLIDEVLAHKGAIQKDPNIAQRIYSAIRRMLRDLGLKVKWSDNDIATLVRNGRKAGEKFEPNAGAAEAPAALKKPKELTPEDMDDIKEVGRANLEKPTKYGAWKKQMRKDIGEVSDASLREVWDAIGGPEQLAGTNESVVSMRKNKKSGDFTTEGLPTETKVDKVMTKLQDRYRRLEVVESTPGLKVSEKTSAFQAQKLTGGKVKKQIDDMKNEYVEPMMRDLAEADVPVFTDGNKTDLPSFEDYLYALHAPERNAHIAGINARFRNIETEEGHVVNEKDLETGSGISNEEAAAIVQRVKDSGKADIYDKAAAKMRELQNKKLDILEQSGRYTKEQIDEWRQYKNYIPLKGIWAHFTPENAARLKVLEKMKNRTPEQKAEMRGLRELRNVAESNKELGTGVGAKLTARYEVKMAKGRKSRATDLLAHAMADVQNAILYKEKNDVLKIFKQMTDENPAPDIWTTNSYEERPYFNRATGEVEYRGAKESTTDAITVYDNGTRYDIHIKDPALKKALKDADPEITGLVGSIFKTTKAINNWLSAVYTRYNPKFILSNLERDLQTAIGNIGSEYDAGIAKNAIKNLPGAIAGVYKEASGKKGGKWAEWASDFREQGGPTETFGGENIDRVKDRLVKTVRLYKKGTPNAGLRFAKGLAAVVENSNRAIEGGTRLAVYKSLVEAGYSKQHAAVAAKNVTVDFGTRGEWGNQIGALFLFANANIQGQVRILKGLKKSNGLRALASAIALGSFGLAQVNRMNAGEDEGGTNYYDKISDAIKQRYWIFIPPEDVRDALDASTPFLAQEGPMKYIRIPLPWGYNVFHAVGISTDKMYNSHDPKGATAYTANAMAQAFNPLGGTGLMSVVPTVLRPIVALWSGQDELGRPTHKEQPFGAKKSRSELAFKTDPMWAKTLAHLINKYTGGSTYQEGALGKYTPAPGELDYLFNTAFGGIGKTVSEVSSTAASVAKGTPAEVGQTPGLNLFIGEIPSNYDERTFYESYKKLERVVTEAKETGDKKAFYAKHGDELKLYERIKPLAERIAELNRGMRDAEKKSASEEIIKNKEKAKLKIMVKANGLMRKD